MNIYIASDHAGFELKTSIIVFFKTKHKIIDCGCYSLERADYPDYAHKLAQELSNDPTAMGIVICGSGNGINMTVNKHIGIRSALCWNIEITKLARQHNNANVMALPARYIQTEEALKMTQVFLTEPFEGGRHQDRINKINPT